MIEHCITEKENVFKDVKVYYPKGRLTNVVIAMEIY